MLNSGVISLTHLILTSILGKRITFEPERAGFDYLTSLFLMVGPDAWSFSTWSPPSLHIEINKFAHFSKCLLTYLSSNSPFMFWNFSPFPCFIIPISQLMAPLSSQLWSHTRKSHGHCRASSSPPLLFFLQLSSWRLIYFVPQFFIPLKFSFLQSEM